MIESVVYDVRYALRGIRRSPLFAASVGGTIGVGLGILCSAFTIVNAYLFKLIDLPDPRQLYSLSWDTADTQRHEFRLDDVAAIAADNPVFATVAAADGVVAMHNGVPLTGLIVTGTYFQVTRAPLQLVRPILPDDTVMPGARPVVVLSHDTWRSTFNADMSIVGRVITLGGIPFHVVGVTRAGTVLPGEETVSFWVPLTMARAFDALDPWQDPNEYSLAVVARAKPDVTYAQSRAWFEAWLRQRFPAGTELAPQVVRVNSLATRIPQTRSTYILFSFLVGSFGLVLLVASANVTNMLLARGLSRQRELGVRLSLGASRSRVVRQLVIESLVLAVPAAALGMVLTLVTAEVFGRLLTTNLPESVSAATFDLYLVSMAPDLRVWGLLVTAAMAAAVFVGLSPAAQLTRTNLVVATKGELSPDTRISRVRTALVVVQVAICAMFLVGAIGFVSKSQRMSRADTGLDYDRVIDVRISESIRPRVAAQLATDPAIAGVAAASRRPFGSLPTLRAKPSQSEIEQSAGYIEVSPEYFPLFGIRATRGRLFTAAEAEQGADVVVVSAATAARFWPGVHPLGQTLDIVPPVTRSSLQPGMTRAYVIGVVEDVFGGTLLDGMAPTYVYFPTTVSSPRAVALLVRGRGPAAVTTKAVAAFMEREHPDVTFRSDGLEHLLALQVWSFRAFSSAAAIPGIVGLLLAFTGTYGVIAFLVTQRTREFGIRMALGASVGRIILSIVGDGARTAAVATAIGLVLALAIERVATAALGIAPIFGARAFVIGGAIVLLAAVLAALLPSLRTGRLNPAVALRAE